MNKRALVVTIATATLAFALAGCASNPLDASTATSEESDSVSTASASSEQQQPDADGPVAGMPNPWHDASNARDAAAGAGIEGFGIPEGEQIGLGPIVPEAYRYMDGLAEADVPVGAAQITIRKGLHETWAGDVSGDYNAYAHEWTQDSNGLQVACFGNREGEATKAIWTKGDYDFCVLAQGLGGDDDFGLGDEDLAALVAGIM